MDAEPRSQLWPVEADEGELRLVLETANDAYVAIDTESTITGWNRQAELTFGWSASEALGRSMPDTIMPERYRELHRDGVGKFLETGEGPVLFKTLELSGLHRDGREFPVELTVWPTRTATGYRFNAFIRDITKRKGAEDTVRRLADIVEFSNDAIYSVDRDGVITSWNGACWLLFGYSAEEAIGRRLEVLIPSTRLGEDRIVLKRALGGDRISDFETDLRRRDGGTVALSVSICPIRDSDGPVTGVSCMARDVSERRRAQEAERISAQREAEVEGLRRVQALQSTFLTAVSHEIRTPLASIFGIVETLRKRGHLLPEHTRDELLELLTSDLRRLDRLLADVLDISQWSEGTIESRRKRTNVTALAGKVQKSLTSRGERIELDGDVVVANVDPKHTERVLKNLLANAIKYTPPDARIWLRLRREGEGLVIIVEDSGPGVPDDLKEAIFEPFRQGDRLEHSPGLGLGLSVVSLLAATHGGRAWVEDRPGGGASFRVLLAPAVERAD